MTVKSLVWGCNIPLILVHAFYQGQFAPLFVPNWMVELGLSLSAICCVIETLLLVAISVMT